MAPTNSHTLDQFLCLGDSLTQHGWDVSKHGWTAQLSQTYLRRLDVINRGFSGFNTRWAKRILPRVMPSDSNAKVRLLTILFGANDAQFSPLKCHVPLDEYKRNIRDIVQMFGADTRILLITPPPVGDALYEQFSDGPVDRCRETTMPYAEAVRELAAELGLPCVDLWAAMEANIDTAGGYDKFLWDGLHLNANGNDLLFSLVVDAIKQNYPELDPDTMSFKIPAYQSFENIDELFEMLDVAK
ncbi:isoamyl acetate-hydrolyzing esterase [Coemansia erecta]|nr:isoamyl acetate-hydrolyzing esterase [Coemansia sp. RSA 2618]KAJ2823860.1 isoamyl acetate-hydrolyzing esterase [Coemansia erecta]